jgi:hypothetical protein
VELKHPILEVQVSSGSRLFHLTYISSTVCSFSVESSSLPTSTVSMAYCGALIRLASISMFTELFILTAI